VAFDWDVAAELAKRVPFLLAGGLTPENVGAAAAQVEPWGVDVSSGVETNGQKDIEKIRAFVRAAKGARVGR
jgi:phosphoribosylanthranilate isomerase